MSKAEELREVYARYSAACGQPREGRSFADAFRGWFTGKGKDLSEDEKAFMVGVGNCVAEIREAGGECAGEAFEACRVIVSEPRNKKITGEDLVYASMHSHVITLAPLLTPGEAEEILREAENIPKSYRFGVYTEMIKALRDRMG